MIDSNAIMTNSSSGASVSATGSGAGLSSKSLKPSPSVDACKKTFQLTLKAAADKSMGIKTSPQGSQGLDDQAMALAELNAAVSKMNPTEAVSTESTGAVASADMEVNDSLPFENLDPNVADAVIQILMMAFQPATDGEATDINEILNGLNDGQKSELLKVLDFLSSKLNQPNVQVFSSQSSPVDALASALNELLGSLSADDTETGGQNGSDFSATLSKLLQMSDIAKTASGQLSDIVKSMNLDTVPQVNQGAAAQNANPVSRIIEQMFAALTDVSEAQQADQTAEISSDPMMAFKARLMAIAQDVRNAAQAANSDFAQPVDGAEVADIVTLAVAPDADAGKTAGDGQFAGSQDSKRDQQPVAATVKDSGALSDVGIFAGNGKIQHSSVFKTEPVINQPQQAQVANIIDQIVKAASMRSNSTMQEMEINLKPEFLGKITIVLSSTEEGIVATLRAASEQVRHALAANIGQLQSVLRESGINMKDISITDAGISSDLANGNFDGQSAMADRRESMENSLRLSRVLSRATRNEQAAVSAGVYDSSQQMPTINSDVGSVEFSA